MMLVNYQASAIAKTVFLGLNNSACFHANLTFSVETLSGQIIQTFQTEDIGGATDNASPYFGYTDIDIKAAFPHFLWLYFYAACRNY
jgi:hypothetical protein